MALKFDPDCFARLKDPKAFLWDVRNADEVAAKALPQARCKPCPMAADPAAVVDEALAEGFLPEDKTTPILVYCAVGGRAGRVSAALKSKGYDAAVNAGGFDMVAAELAKA